MKFVKLKGGLGNQLFQYAFLKALQLTYDQEVKADLSYYSSIENDTVRIPRIEQLKVNIAKATPCELSDVCMLQHAGDPRKLNYKIGVFLEKTLNRSYYFESDRQYRDPGKILNYQYFDGYWQSYKYLEGIEDDIRNEVVMKGDFSEAAKAMISQIRNENAVFIGVRRGDYLANARSKRRFGYFGDDYFTQAISTIKERVNDPVFYVFSNDIEGVKQTIRFNEKVIYREEKHQISDVEELFIMASCRHAIIVNSTFYWWGAWLIENEDKVIVAPRRWFADGAAVDIIPDSWIKL